MAESRKPNQWLMQHPESNRKQYGNWVRKVIGKYYLLAVCVNKEEYGMINHKNSCKYENLFEWLQV